MPIVLPDPSLDQLANSPLKLVVCQVRFEEMLSVTDPKVALETYQHLGGRDGPYGVLEQFRGAQLDLKVAAGSPISAQQTPLTGWRIRSEDRSWNVTLLPDSVALETTAYTTWAADFKPRIEALVDAASEVLRPALQVRVGLRYVDLIRGDTIPTLADWSGRISDSLLGPVLHPVLGSAVIAAQQQVDLDVGDGTRCTLRHGTVSDAAQGGRGYLLDWDVYDDAAKAFDATSVKTALGLFNTLAVQLFQQAITPELLTDLKG